MFCWRYFIHSTYEGFCCWIVDGGVQNVWTNRVWITDPLQINILQETKKSQIVIISWAWIYTKIPQTKISFMWKVYK